MPDRVRHESPDPARLLGRDEELAALEALLARAHVLALTGPPGIGKSRLALELARAAAEDYPDGTKIVELAALGEDALVPQALAAALPVKEAPGESLTERVLAELGDRRLLLVLDNCEHLLGACATLVTRLVEGCPQLTVIATSREPLGIRAECVWQVPPLAVPHRSSEPLPTQELLDYASVRLFVERARALEPDFSLNDYVAPVVAEICRSLDGIPLAIELAAARVESLTPPEIAARLADRFGFLTSGSESDPPRHQTLAAALAWSEGLLSDAERTLLRRLSVFAGSLEPEAAKAVCGGGDLDRGDVEELLGQLVAKSLVVPPDESGRHRLLETIRAYAAEQLEQAGEVRTRREAHALFYTELAERAEPELRGPGLAEWLDRLEADHANLRAALDWSLGHGRAEWALRLSSSLVWFWRMRSHFSEGRSLLEAALSASEGHHPDLEAKTLWGAGFLTLMTGDSQRAADLFEDSGERFRALGAPQAEARALLLLANALQEIDAQRVPDVAGRSAELARAEGDLSCLGLALSLAGQEYVNRGEFSTARPLLEESMTVAAECGDLACLQRTLLFLGEIALFQGDYGAAERQLEAALSLSQQLGDDLHIGTTFQYLGGLALHRGDHVRARELLDEAIDLLRATRPRDLMVALTERSRVARIEGDRSLARELLTEASDVVRLDDERASPLLGLGELEAEVGNIASAQRYFEEALEWSRAHGHAYLSAAALLGLGRLAREAGETQKMTLALSEALELAEQCGAVPMMVAALEGLAYLAAEAGPTEQAARLFAAMEATRAKNGYGRSEVEVGRHEAELESLRDGLSADEFRRAWAEGSMLSIEEAIAEAGRRRRRQGKAASGWESLTDAERNVAALVAEGMTNKAIAEHLVIVLATVKTHLEHIFAKLGISSRSELTKQVWRRGGTGR